MPRTEGNATPGGPLAMRGIPLPTGTVTHHPPRDLPKPKPLPAIAGAHRGYIRKWAVSRGYRVATIGALPRAVLDAYEQAVSEL